jgi:hypothetical protein
VEPHGARKTPLSLVILDVDHFKRYNDRYGHLAGDCCLRRVAEALDAMMRRPADMIARYGGEEFAAILPGTSLEGAQLVAESMRLTVAGLEIEHAGFAGPKRGHHQPGGELRDPDSRLHLFGPDPGGGPGPLPGQAGRPRPLGPRRLRAGGLQVSVELDNPSCQSWHMMTVERMQ